jgi:hypothetical protein
VYENIPSCPKPQNLNIVNLGSDSADIGWTAQGSGTSWEVEYGLAGFTQGTGTIMVTSNNPYQIKNLNSSTAYDFYVREICGNQDSSVWSGPLTFNTNIAGPRGVNCITGASSIVFTEEFDAVGGWTGDVATGSSAGDWGFGFSGAPTSTNTGPSGAHSGANYAYVETSGSAGNPWGTNAIMVSPAIDLTQVNDSAELTFWLHAYGQTMGTLNVGIGTSPTGPFTNAFTWSGELQTAETDPFQQVGIRLDQYVGQTIYLEFDFLIGNNFYSDIAIDLLEVRSCVSCALPSNVRDSALTSNSLELNWDQNGSVVSWDVEYGPAGFTRGNGTLINTTSKPLSITGLNSVTSYDFYVRSNCSATDSSGWTTPFNVTTPCAPFTATYYNDFELDPLDEAPQCWLEYETYGSGWVEVEDFTGTAAPYSGSQALYIYSGSGFTQGSDTLAAISPQFTDLPVGDKRIRFQGNSDDPTTTLIVGTIDMPDPNGTFTAIDTIIFPLADTYDEYTVDFTTASGYNGTDEYIVLVHDLNNTFDYIRIDEFRYETIPSCVRPSNLTASNPTLTSVDLDWVENNSATQWEISYGMAGFTPGSGTQVTATAKPFTLAGLSPSTSMEYYVRSLCSTAAGDTSFWEGPVPFNTLNAVPYFQDFESFGANTGPVSTAGWSNFSGTNPKWESGSSTTSTATGPSVDHTLGTSAGTFMYLETSSPSSTGDTDTLYSAPISVGATIDTVELDFWYHMYGADINALEVYLDTNASGNYIFVDDIQGQQQTTQASPWLNLTNKIGGLNGTSLRILFVGIAGASFDGDIAIDDVLLKDALTGVSLFSSENETFEVYPNPSNGLFTLNVETTQEEDFNMVVRDVKGKLVYENNVSVNGVYNESMDFSHLAKGVYYLQVQSENATRVEKLVIK